jgi:hypothetical protein
LIYINRLIIFAVAILFGSCGFSDETHFKNHVIDEAKSIKELKYGSAPCMHCPMYFRFEATSDVIAKLIAKHELNEIESVPELMQQVISLLDAKWWIDKQSLLSTKKYWIEYEPKSFADEPRMRLMLVRGGTVYFATTGYFDKSKYRKVESKRSP